MLLSTATIIVVYLIGVLAAWTLSPTMRARSVIVIALLFVAFDIEVIFIYLWALIFRELLVGGLVTMGIFVAILLLGLAYAWRKDVLRWR